MTNQTKHALLSASGAHRWLACPPSARLEQLFSAPTSTYAEEGTIAHAAAELAASYALGDMTKEQHEERLAILAENPYYNKEMQECADAYASFILQRLAEAKKTCADPIVNLETCLDFSDWVPGGFGTGDCLIIAEPALSVRYYPH